MFEESQLEIVVPINLRELMADIEAIVPEGGDWCSVDKALALTTLIVGLRPKTVVELGVWQGGSAIPMAIALHRLGVGRLIAVDSWSAESSIAGQEVAHAQWWGEKMGDAGHDLALETFMKRLAKHEIGSERCWVVRQRTDEAIVPESIDILHHDANHGPQVVLDIQRWAPAIRVGGILVIGDLNWPGGHVARARDLAIEMGFVELYQIGTGCVMQRMAPRTTGTVRRLRDVLQSATTMTEDALLAHVLHPFDKGASWIHQGTYLWYWAIGRALRPTSILEIGTRFGYSLVSLIEGSERVSRVASYDMELDHAGSIDYVEAHIRARYSGVAVRSVLADTQKLDALSADDPVDLAHVDGDHSEEGCYHDCKLASAAVRDGGWLIVDDVGEAAGDPRARCGADRFLRERDLSPIFIDSYRGMYLVRLTRLTS